MTLDQANSVICDIDQLEDSLSCLKTGLPDADVVEYTRAFVRVRGVKDRLDEVVKAFNSVYEELKTIKLPAKFEEAGVPTINLDEGFRVTVGHRLFASIKGGMKEEAYQWLRDNDLADLVTETVNASTLSAVAKSMAEENRELNEDLFSVAILPTTSVTKTKK